MSMFILDCSVTASWCFEDEASEITDSLLDRLRDHGAIAPALWLSEVANMLLQSEKRGRITRSKLASFLKTLDLLPIMIEPAAKKQAFSNVIELAHREGLTTYDATYLESAMRNNLPLATSDKALIRACKNHGINALPAIH